MRRELVGLLGISRDVTKRVAAEQAANVEKERALQAVQAKSELLKEDQQHFLALPNQGFESHRVVCTRANSLSLVAWANSTSDAMSSGPRSSCRS